MHLTQGMTRRVALGATAVAVGAAGALVAFASGPSAPVPQASNGVLVSTPSGPLEIPDPSSVVDAQSLEYASETTGAAFFRAAGRNAGTQCLLIAAKPASRLSGQVGCDTDAAIAKGDIWMTEEIGPAGQVGAMLLPVNATKATVNDTPVGIQGGVLPLSGPRGIKLTVIAYGGDGAEIFRKVLPASVGDLSANAKVSTVVAP